MFELNLALINLIYLKLILITVVLFLIFTKQYLINHLLFYMQFFLVILIN